MTFRPFSAFWSRIAVSFALFVAMGSTALVFWLQSMAQRESEHVFTALARTNAQFIKSARLAPVSRVAEPLGRVLGMQMFFRRNAGPLVPSPDPSLEAALSKVVPERGIVHLGRDAEAIAMPVEPGLDLLLVRPVEPKQEFLRRPSTHAILGSFWLLSLALAWSVTRGVVRPLRLLASRLPLIEKDAEATLPGAERHDEIGEVARAYLATRAQLASERERRIAAERFALLGRMATGLAHEIHNPLSAIRLHAQLLSTAAPGELAAANAESVPVLLSEAARIESLVNQWMFLARPAPPQVARTGLGEAVANIVRMQAALARHAGVEIEETVPRDLYADVDRRRFTQAVCNIVVNAIQAMPGGGRLTIAGEAGKDARLVFQDTGSGFSAAALARHAELFFSEKEGGMGIGLSVSSEILKAHGGALLAENTPGVGAKVTLILPLSTLPA
ncbi:MAG: ATP-binding protein [Chthoniobacteraceae bacterium]|nr:ATP-binding protein [Chthoniobacteraceae bacterium]